MGYRQPTVRGRGPLSPRRGDLLELRGSGQTRIHQLVSQIGLQNPVGHTRPHHSRAEAVAKHQTLAVGVTSSNPAARAQDSSRRPASGSPPLARAARS